MQYDADASTGDPRSFAESEDLLNPDGQDRRPPLLIDDADPAAAGDADAFGCFALDGLALRIGQPAL